MSTKSPVTASWWKEFFDGSLFFDVWRSVMPESMSASEAEGIEKLLALAPGSRVLDVPCGHGRIALELAARGHQVAGFDLSSYEIEYGEAKAKARGVTVDWKRGDMRELPYGPEFDAVICYGNSFGYFDDADNDRFLASMLRALKPGGKMLIDAICAETLIPHLKLRDWYKAGDTFFLMERTYDVPRGRLDVLYTYVKKDGAVEQRPASYRVHTFLEFSNVVSRAGFTDVAGYGALSGQKVEFGSNRLVVVAVKPAV